MREALCVSPACNDLHALEREESTGSKVGLGYGELRGEIGAGVGEREAVPAKPGHPCVAGTGRLLLRKFSQSSTSVL